MASPLPPDPVGTFSVTDVVTAMTTMRTGDQDSKTKAHAFLERFQKSRDAWGVTINTLQGPKVEADIQLFAAITLRGKITYDFSSQVAPENRESLRDQILLLLKQYAAGPAPVRLQLCVCLAILAIQMLAWKDVLPFVVGALGDSPAHHACLLDFLRVLPEEVTEGRKITLTEDELIQRTNELLSENGDTVVNILESYASSSPEASHNAQLLDCITSWIREVPLERVLRSGLLDVIFRGVTDPLIYESASECLCTVLRETRDVNEYQEAIGILLPRVVQLQPFIVRAVNEDVDQYRALTKVFATAGESWAVAMARSPQTFGALTEAILECVVHDKEQDVVEYTFNFWYELKQYLELDAYMEARIQYVEVYSRLVDVLLVHLRFPVPESGDQTDLFDGDREQEEKFREFRHQMGDTMKDAYLVMGGTECLTKILAAIQQWMGTYASQASEENVPHWQELEAPIFAFRALGLCVDRREQVILPQLIPLLVQIPRHEKLRFATIMALGRYTEWTAEHPEYLEAQFKYIVSSFEQVDSNEIVSAAALSIKYMCTDCRHLLSGQVVELQHFYDQILDRLSDGNKRLITEGVANVVAVQPVSEIQRLLKLYCDPLVQRLMRMANSTTTDEQKVDLAQMIRILTIFPQEVSVYVDTTGEKEGEDVVAHPAVEYWKEVFPILATVLDNFVDSVPVCEAITRCWREMIRSYRTAMAPLLPLLADKLTTGFTRSREGCFLWATAAILGEFAETREHVDAQLASSIYAFFEVQVTTFLTVLVQIPPRDQPNVVEDFFQLMMDALLYYPQRVVTSPLMPSIIDAAIYSLNLEAADPLVPTMIFLYDFLAYGLDRLAISKRLPQTVAEQLRPVVRGAVLQAGERIVRQVLAGMMLTFPPDVFAHASRILLDLFQLVPVETATWVEKTIRLLPEGTVSEAEIVRLMTKIRQRIQTQAQTQPPSSASSSSQQQASSPPPPGALTPPPGLATASSQSVTDTSSPSSPSVLPSPPSSIRSLLQDFTNQYRRRNVAPRDGLGQLGARFSFAG